MNITITQSGIATSIKPMPHDPLGSVTVATGRSETSQPDFASMITVALDTQSPGTVTVEKPLGDLKFSKDGDANEIDNSAPTENAAQDTHELCEAPMPHNMIVPLRTPLVASAKTSGEPPASLPSALPSTEFEQLSFQAKTMPPASTSDGQKTGAKIIPSEQGTNPARSAELAVAARVPLEGRYDPVIPSQETKVILPSQDILKSGSEISATAGYSAKNSNPSFGNSEVNARAVSPRPEPPFTLIGDRASQAPRPADQIMKAANTLNAGLTLSSAKTPPTSLLAAVHQPSPTSASRLAGDKPDLEATRPPTPRAQSQQAGFEHITLPQRTASAVHTDPSQTPTPEIAGNTTADHRDNSATYSRLTSLTTTPGHATQMHSTVMQAQSPAPSTHGSLPLNRGGSTLSYDSLLVPADVQELFNWDPSRALPTHQNANAPLRPELTQHVARQLSEGMTQAAHKPIEIALSPVELGRVRMSVVTEDGRITVNILAERPDTLDLMRRHIDQLGQTFRSMGYEQITFSFGQGAGSGDQGDSSPKDDTSNQTTLGAGTDTKPQQEQNIIQLDSAVSTGIDIRL